MRATPIKYFVVDVSFEDMSNATTIDANHSASYLLGLLPNYRGWELPPFGAEGVAMRFCFNYVENRSDQEIIEGTIKAIRSILGLPQQENK